MIREIDRNDIPACADVIEEAFMTVADEFGFAPDNVPRFTATDDDSLIVNTQGINLCYCGHDCAKCVTYLATKNNDDALREQPRRFYQEEFGQDIPLEQFNCSGGRSDDVFALCQQCPFKRCCKEKNVESCCECPEYPCKTLSDYQAQYVNQCNQIQG